jgi:galactose mutarotase-like enzyme
MKLRAIRNSILFAFLQKENNKGYFQEETKWGFTIAADKSRQKSGFDQSVKEGRWAKVLLVGPECEEVKTGDYVCLEPQMWTNGFQYDGIKIRKSDESKVMIISKEMPDVFL